MKKIINKETLLLAVGVAVGLVGSNYIAPHVAKLPIIGDYPESVGGVMVAGSIVGKKYLPKEVKNIVFTAGITSLVQTLVCRIKTA